MSTDIITKNPGLCPERQVRDPTLDEVVDEKEDPTLCPICLCGGSDLFLPCAHYCHRACQKKCPKPNICTVCQQDSLANFNEMKEELKQIVTTASGGSGVDASTWTGDDDEKFSLEILNDLGFDFGSIIVHPWVNPDVRRCIDCQKEHSRYTERCNTCEDENKKMNRTARE